MVLDKRRNEKIRMIVTFVHPQCEGDTGSSAATFQKLRFELGFQKLVCGALVDEQLCQARAIFKQSTSVLSSPALLIAAEISIECLLAPWTVHGCADRRKSRDRRITRWVAQSDSEGAMPSHRVAHDALARDIGRQFRTYHCGKFTLNVTRHSVIPGPRGLRSIDIKPSAQSKVI